MSPLARMLAGPLALAAAAAACGEDNPGYPVNPGGGGGGGGTLFPDAAMFDPDASTVINGRVCLIADARAPTTCAASGADQLTVDLGGVQALTAGDGSFTIARPANGTGLVWVVTGAGIETSVMSFAAASSGATIPAISALLYGEMLAGSFATVAVDTGAIIARVSGSSVTGLIATPTPTVDGVYYDGATATEWTQDMTGGAGVVWIPSTAPGFASITFGTGQGTTTVSDIPVIADAITFVFHSRP